MTAAVHEPSLAIAHRQSVEFAAHRLLLENPCCATTTNTSLPLCADKMHFRRRRSGNRDETLLRIEAQIVELDGRADELFWAVAMEEEEEEAVGVDKGHVGGCRGRAEASGTDRSRGFVAFGHISLNSTPRPSQPIAQAISLSLSPHLYYKA
jgi:hypothetical protein